MMRRPIVILALGLMLAGCKTADDIRTRHQIGQSETQVPVNELAGCITLVLQAPGHEVSRKDLPNGVTLSVLMRASGIPSIVSVFDIENLGDRRRVTLYSLGAKADLTKPISGPATRCL